MTTNQKHRGTVASLACSVAREWVRRLGGFEAFVAAERAAENAKDDAEARAMRLLAKAILAGGVA